MCDIRVLVCDVLSALEQKNTHDLYFLEWNMSQTT